MSQDDDVLTLARRALGSNGDPEALVRLVATLVRSQAGAPSVRPARLALNSNYMSCYDPHFMPVKLPAKDDLPAWQFHWFHLATGLLNQLLADAAARGVVISKPGDTRLDFDANKHSSMIIACAELAT